MNPIETLTALDGLRRELHCQREKIACLEAAARYLSPAGDGIGGGSGPSDRVGKMAGQIADERAELERMEERYFQTMTKATEILEQLSNPLEREILAKRYIAGLNWEQISRKMNYSASGIHRIKKAALQKLCSQMNLSEPK